MAASGSRCVLQHQRAAEVDRAELAVLSDLAAAAVGQAVEPQIVLVEIDLGEQLPLELFEAHQVDLAFEYGLLNALAGALADLRDPTQTPSASAGFGVDVIADKDKHVLPHHKGKVFRHLAPHGAGEEPRLHERSEPERNGLREERVCELFLLAFLPGDDDRLACVAFE